MILSMTGYARHETTVGGNVLTWEARSVNHRFLEISFRLPDELRGQEPRFKASVQARLGRGKVDLGLRLAQAPSAPAPFIVDEDLVMRLREAAGRIDSLTGSAGGLRAIDLLRWPGVLQEPAPQVEGLAEVAMTALATTLDGLVEARSAEGQRLAEMLEARCAQILSLTELVSKRLPQLQTEQLERMRARIARLDVDVDAGRLEQEVALITSRMDVAEELDRLNAHVAQLRDVLRKNEPVGRRLDFLIQELNREANTLSSKSVDMEVTRAAVELKVQIEQMREQVQNVE